ncbi:MAG: hypothetical protein ACYTKD_24415 [Planctomycetota bacterium]|jgi:hypothetical protein
MGIAEAFAGAMRALVAIDEPLRRRIADAYLCLFCWGVLHVEDGVPPGVRELLDDVQARIAEVDAGRPLSSRIRLWADGLSDTQAREAGLRIVDAFREVTLSPNH